MSDAIGDRVGGAAIPAAVIATLAATPPDPAGGRAPADLPEIRGDIPVDPELIRDWTVRDQFGDPTCVAFAVAAALEFRLARRFRSPPRWLSPAQLYWNMRSAFPPQGKLPIGYENGATLLGQARDALAARGLCLEALRRYGSARYRPTADGTHMAWTDPADPVALAEALAAADQEGLSRRLETAALAHEHIPQGSCFAGACPVDPLSERFHRALSAGRPVVVAVPVWPTRETGTLGNWATVEARDLGVVRAPCDPDHDIPDAKAIVAGHAVCLVGFWEGRVAGDRGWFIFRNSLNADFGRHAEIEDNGVPAGGYGVLSAQQIDEYCWEYLIFEEEDSAAESDRSGPAGRDRAA